jgi:RND family efflux transporter MFP subunit
MIIKHQKLQLLWSCFAVFFLVSCTSEPAGETTTTVVKTAKVKLHNKPLNKNYPARIQSKSNVRLSFRVAGPIQKVYVSEGDYVANGKLLAQIDPRDYKIQQQATEAKYNEIKSEADRIMALHNKGKVSDNEYDKAVSGLLQITAKYVAAKNALEDTRLVAPASGHIHKVFFDANETVDAGMPVVSITDTQRYEIVTHIPPDDVLNQDQFESFLCKTSDNPEKEWPLKLKNIVSQANLNGLHPAYFSFTDGNSNNILPGMSAEIIINYKAQKDGFFTVPSTPLFHKNGQTKLWKLDTTQNTVHSLEVEIIRINSAGQAIITGKMKDNESIVSAGVNSLTEGQKVTELEKPSDSNVGDLL